MPPKQWNEFGAIAQEYNAFCMDEPQVDANRAIPVAEITVKMGEKGAQTDSSTTGEYQGGQVECPMPPATKPVDLEDIFHTPCRVTNAKGGVHHTGDMDATIWCAFENDSANLKRVIPSGSSINLKVGTEVHVVILDVWSCILNDQERSKLDGAPSRLFAATSKTFFSPIIKGAHYYVMSVDTKGKRSEINDNSSTHILNEAKYEDTPEDLELSSKNKVNCAIYAMRHMETYIEHVVSRRDYGLCKGDINELHTFRMYFMREILMSKIKVHQTS